MDKPQLLKEYLRELMMFVCVRYCLLKGQEGMLLLSYYAFSSLRKSDKQMFPSEGLFPT